MTIATQPLSKTAKKYHALVISGHIEEREIISLKSFMGKNKSNARLVFDWLNDMPSNLSLSAGQNQKGYDFLMKCWKTDTGKERKNNPFGYREQHILENFSHFELSSFYNAGNAYRDFYLPLYFCVSKDGSTFEYYYNGKVNITG